MAKYKFIADYEATTKNYSLGPNAPEIKKLFKKDDEIEGIIIENGFVSTSLEGTLPSQSLGALTYAIPVSNLIIIAEATVPETVILSQPKTFFTARNIIIIIIILLALFAAYHFLTR